jgi:LEA14-like dessication related protein
MFAVKFIKVLFRDKFHVDNINMRKFLFFLSLFSLLIACKSPPSAPPEIIPELAEIFEEEPEIEILEPDFNVVSIVIIQADLINTQFEAVVRIDNPNDFAVSLSSLHYELYGNGRFWADGREKNILQIPAKSSCETELHFSMNFINMSRALLDDIIAMRQVSYRFIGDAEVEVGIPRVPPFQMSFERSGLSDVKRK